MKYPNKYTYIASIIAAGTIALNIVHAQSTETTVELTESELQTTETDVTDTSSDIRIRQAGTTTVKEFHQQGKVYKVEIAPKNTPAYILSDQDGNGNLNSSDTGIDSDLVVPEWTIGNW